MTKSANYICPDAIARGFIVKIATITLLDNWNYGVITEKFKNSIFYIGIPKKYDQQ